MEGVDEKMKELVGVCDAVCGRVVKALLFNAM